MGIGNQGFNGHSLLFFASNPSDKSVQKVQAGKFDEGSKNQGEAEDDEHIQGCRVSNLKANVIDEPEVTLIPLAHLWFAFPAKSNCHDGQDGGRTQTCSGWNLASFFCFNQPECHPRAHDYQR